MSTRFGRGVVVGKLAPLHRGHELLIRRAISQCDRVVVMSWVVPAIAGCEPEKRERWIRALFPEVTPLVITEAMLAERASAELARMGLPGPEHDETVHRRFVGLACRELLGVDIDAVFSSEAYGPGFARELTHLYRETDPTRAAVEHVPVDPDRRTVPISASAIRANVHAHRRWLSPVVYADFVERVVLLGGESSGKSTLAAELARRHGTVSVAEYGRELWERREGRLAFEDLLAIGEVQIRREEEAAGRARRFLFCDTSPLTTLFYSREMFGRAEPRLEALAERRYDRVVLCAPDFPFVQDGTRREPGFRERQHRWYERELAARGIPWLPARGTLEDRIRSVSASIGASPSDP